MKERVLGGRFRPMLILIGLLAGTFGSTLSATTDRPNFVMIVADDLGFSDLGCFGGEIRTPNLDRLATEGLRFTNFYVSISCSPTRAMLLSGLDNHVTGMGNMFERTAPNQVAAEGYEGVLREDLTTIADVLLDNGYHTYMTGKWHLGHSPAHIPRARGFERSFSLLNSAGSHFDKTGYRIENETSEFTADGEYLEKLPKGYYSSKTFTDKIIEFITSNEDDGKPFFAYLAFQAPHDPLQVPDSWLRKYKGKYDAGWDATREKRLERMKQMGILPDSAELAPRLWYIPGWDKLTGIAQVQAARKMEVYAAMVEHLDAQVGRLVEFLQEHDLDNTYILFFSDNGPESSDAISAAKKRPGAASSNFFAQNYRTDFASWGRKDSYLAYGQAWAQVSATPFYMFKGSMFEGGIRSPLLVWRPNLAESGSLNTSEVLHVSDVAPTLLDLAGIPRSALFSADKNRVQTGKSWKSLIVSQKGAPRPADEGIGMEMWGGRAYRQGPWKLTWMHKPFGQDDWQLFNVVQDPAERYDLSAEHPATKAKLIRAWEAYAEANNVLIPDRTEYDGLEENLPPRPPVESPGWPRGQEPNWTTEEDGDDDE